MVIIRGQDGVKILTYNEILNGQSTEELNRIETPIQIHGSIENKIK